MKKLRVCLICTGVFIINPNQMHATQSPEKNHVLVIQFPLEFLKEISKVKYNRLWFFSANTVKEKIDDKNIFNNLNKLAVLSKKDDIQHDEMGLMNWSSFDLKLS